MKKITNCPFCNSTDVYVSGDMRKFYVICGKCGAVGPVGSTQDRAEHLWNRSNDNTAALVALVEVITNRPEIANYLATTRGTKTTWKMACEQTL